MTGHFGPRNNYAKSLAAAVRIVPREIRDTAHVGSLAEGPAELAARILRKLTDSRMARVTVLADLDGMVYACKRGGKTLTDLETRAPYIFVGTYNREADPAHIAEDLETMRRAA